MDVLYVLYIKRVGSEVEVRKKKGRRSGKKVESGRHLIPIFPRKAAKSASAVLSSTLQFSNIFRVFLWTLLTLTHNNNYNLAN